MIGKIQPYQAPTINKIAPRIVRAGGRSCETSRRRLRATRPDTFGFWFNYFWTEVQQLDRITALQQQKAAEVFFSVFEGAQAPFTLRADFAGATMRSRRTCCASSCSSASSGWRSMPRP